MGLFGSILGAVGGIANIIGGSQAAKSAQNNINALNKLEPTATVSSFYQDNVNAANQAGSQQMQFANQMAGMSNTYAQNLQNQQQQFGQQYQAGANKAAGQMEQMGKMAFQRGLGAAGQMGMDQISQQGAGAMRGVSDRRMAGGMAGGLLRSQQAGIQNLVGQGYQAATQGLGTMMSASQAAANLRQQALGTVYQSGVQASQMGFGAQQSGLQNQEQAGLTGYQLGAQAGQQLAGAQERKQQADWESWANKYQTANSQLAAAKQQQSSGWGGLAGAAGSALGGGLFSGVSKAASAASSATGVNLNSFASGANPSAFGTNFMKF